MRTSIFGHVASSTRFNQNFEKGPILITINNLQWKTFCTCDRTLTHGEFQRVLLRRKIVLRFTVCGIQYKHSLSCKSLKYSVILHLRDEPVMCNKVWDGMIGGLGGVRGWREKEVRDAPYLISLTLSWHTLHLQCVVQAHHMTHLASPVCSTGTPHGGSAAIIAAPGQWFASIRVMTVSWGREEQGGGDEGKGGARGWGWGEGRKEAGMMLVMMKTMMISTDREHQKRQNEGQVVHLSPVYAS